MCRSLCATSVCGLKLLVHEALIQPLKVRQHFPGVPQPLCYLCGLKLLVHEALTQPLKVRQYFPGVPQPLSPAPPFVREALSAAPRPAAFPPAVVKSISNEQ